MNYFKKGFPTNCWFEFIELELTGCELFKKGSPTNCWFEFIELE